MSVPKYLSPLIVGLAVLGIGVSFGYNAGYAINPARDFAPRYIYQFLKTNKKEFSLDSVAKFIGYGFVGFLKGLISMVFLESKPQVKIVKS